MPDIAPLIFLNFTDSLLFLSILHLHTDVKLHAVFRHSLPCGGLHEEEFRIMIVLFTACSRFAQN
jgi:hypothetical protein